jgi:hypothetical protein
MWRDPFDSRRLTQKRREKLGRLLWPESPERAARLVRPTLARIHELDSAAEIAFDCRTGQRRCFHLPRTRQTVRVRFSPDQALGKKRGEMLNWRTMA